ncbi:unnamed protein product [Paramecium sonneborni]|uniref:HotDog ACOT-type domain-containing protein n=1 Tax=Paramecium sonneborni TaxID=65129 RepID=A0A8S1RJ34_9CILI|nr:unnamed protein product [Paramecium sonneborni]
MTLPKFSLLANKLAQIRAKQLALNFNEEWLKPLILSDQKINQLVPNFFTNQSNFELYELKDQYKTLPDSQNFNSTSNTFTQLKIPIGQNQRLRTQFTKLSTKYARIGRLLEVLDLQVGLVGYKHAYADFTNRQITIATLGVYDFLFYKQEFDYNKDIIMNSYVSYVGKSSIEINSDLFQDNQLAATVSFVMVSRNAEKYDQAQSVPQLLDELHPNIKESCFIRRSLGKLNQQRRIQESKLQQEPPNQNESKYLHDMMKKRDDSLYISQTKLDKNIMMHTQDRNLHGKAFGGHIMKEIIELGWLVGYKHTIGNDVFIIHIFDVTFLAPVAIGSIINQSGKICYVEDDIMIIQVQVDVHNYNDSKVTILKTTEVYLAMKSSVLIKQVQPQTYEEAMLFLHGKRLMDKLKYD